MSRADELRARLAIIEKARHDLLTFAQFMMPDRQHPNDISKSAYEIALHHRIIAALLEQVESGAIPRAMITVAPRHGKTELTSKLLPSWLMGRNPWKSVMVGAYNNEFSEDFGQAIRRYMMSPRYKQVFPDCKLVLKSSKKLVTSAGGYVVSVGRQGSATGRGGDLILIDDPYKSGKETLTQHMRDDIWKWFVEVFLSRFMDQAASMVIIQTRWHEDDLVGRITDENNPCFDAKLAAKWKILSLPALAEADDPLGRKEGEALWPARFGEEFLDDQRRAMGRSFYALYQGNPTPDDGAFFRDKDLHTYDSMRDLPENMRFYAASDHAIALAQHNDRTCGGVVGVDENETIWVLPDLMWGRYDANTQVERMLWLIRRHKPIFWWAENGHITKSLGPFLRKRMMESNARSAIVEITPHQDKTARAQAIHGRISMGMVRFPKFAKWWSNGRAELLRFPFGRFDDFVDFMSLIGLGMDLQHSAQRPKPRPDAPKHKTAAWLFSETRRQDAERRRAISLSGW